MKSPYFVSFAFKSKNFVQILENFACTRVLVSIRFRNSAAHLYNFMKVIAFDLVFTEYSNF